jgi:hypothetical protein
MKSEHSTALDSIFEELAAETGGDAEMMKIAFFRKIREPR